MSYFKIGSIRQSSADLLAKTLNGKQILEIARRATEGENIAKIFNINGESMDIDCKLIEASKSLEKDICAYEIQGYKVDYSNKKRNGTVLVRKDGDNGYRLLSPFERMRNMIKQIDINLNILDGNLEAVGRHRYRRIQGRTRNNRLTKMFNKLIRSPQIYREYFV